MYFITCFEKIDQGKFGLDIGASRTMGYYNNFYDASAVVRRNICDIHETIYHYAVIEEISEGVYPIVISRCFYKYNNKKNEYIGIEEPDEFKHYSNIALG